jgi:hypothetical protein
MIVEEKSLFSKNEMTKTKQFLRKLSNQSQVNCWRYQGNLTEGEGSVQLASLY